MTGLGTNDRLGTNNRGLGTNRLGKNDRGMNDWQGSNERFGNK